MREERRDDAGQDVARTRGREGARAGYVDVHRPAVVHERRVALEQRRYPGAVDERAQAVDPSTRRDRAFTGEPRELACVRREHARFAA